MSFQAYIDNIKAQTGMTPDDFRAAAKKKGLLEPDVKTAEIVAWLKNDYGLGRGHAMALVLLFKEDSAPKMSPDETIDNFFNNGKSNWRGTYDQLMEKVEKLGDDIHVSPTDTYLSLLKGKKKFAVIGVTTNRLDIGVKLKSVEPGGRLEASGSWNSMVTHRVRIFEPGQVDKEVLSWLKSAYDAA